MIIEKLILFFIVSVPIMTVSRKTFFQVRSHGFYRFFSWECIAWLAVCNYRIWFIAPFSLLQIFSWIFLFVSGWLVIVGVIQLKKRGKQLPKRDDHTLYAFEKTTALVTTGVYRYIRHPLYSSLLFLTWGVYLKNATMPLLFVAMLSTACLVITALCDERECSQFFGEPYRAYMLRSKRFIPFII